MVGVSRERDRTASSFMMAEMSAEEVAWFFRTWWLGRHGRLPLWIEQGHA